MGRIIFIFNVVSVVIVLCLCPFYIVMWEGCDLFWLLGGITFPKDGYNNCLSMSPPLVTGWGFMNKQKIK